MTYSEKLRDPRWQKLRLEIMQRDAFKCRRCHSSKKTLNVHHGYYQKGANPWDYPNDSLVTVCEECHSAMEAYRIEILKATTNPHNQKLIAYCCRAISGFDGLYPKSLVGFMDSVQEFIRASEAWEFTPNEDPVDAAVALDSAAMNLNYSMVQTKREWVFEAQSCNQPQKSLDQIIAEAPSEPDHEIQDGEEASI